MANPFGAVAPWDPRNAVPNGASVTTKSGGKYKTPKANDRTKLPAPVPANNAGARPGYVSPFATSAGGFGLHGDASEAIQSRENVTQMQRFLQHQGYDIPVTGELDPRTKAAADDWHGPRNPKMWSETQASGGRTPASTQGDTAPPSGPPPVVTPTADTTSAMAWLQSLLKGGVGGPAIPALPGYENPNQLVLPGAPQLPGLNLPDVPKMPQLRLPQFPSNLPSIPNQPVQAHLIDPKQAAAVAQGAYKVPIAQTQQAITQQQAQGSADTSDIQDWFQGAINQNKAGQTDSDAFLKQILGDSNAAAQGIASSLSDPAAAAQAAKTAAISQGLLGGTGVAQHNYQNNFGTALALTGADELRDQKRLNNSALSALQNQLLNLQTQGGVDAATANFNAGVDNNQTLANTEDRNYNRLTNSIDSRRQNILDRFSGQTDRASALYGANRQNILDTYSAGRQNLVDSYNANRANITDTYGANRQNAVDSYNANTSNYNNGYQSQVQNLKDTYQMALQGDASALTKLTVMAELPGGVQQQAQQLLQGMQAIRGNEISNDAAQWAYEHPKAAQQGFNLTDASQQTGLRQSLVGLIANGKTGKIALRPAQAADKIKAYLKGFGLDQDPVAIRLAQSALQGVLDNGGYGGVKVSPYGIGVYGRVATKK